MSVVERLRRTGQYVGEVASKSVGVGVYQEIRQVNKILVQIGQPNIHQIAQVVGTLGNVLLPATMYLTLSEEDSSSKSKTIKSRLITGAKLLGRLGIDLSTLVIPIAALTTTENSLPLLGYIGKPVCNAVVYAALDAMNASAFKRKDLPRGPEGTYDLLQGAYKENYDPHLKIGVIKDSQGRVVGTVLKEAVCARTGGSCMELFLPKGEGEERWLKVAHVTEKDVVVNIFSEKTPKSPPKVEELMEDLKKYFSQK